MPPCGHGECKSAVNGVHKQSWLRRILKLDPRIGEMLCLRKAVRQ